MIAVVNRTENGWCVSTTSPSKMPYKDLTRFRDAYLFARQHLAANGGGRLICLAMSGWVTEDAEVPAR